MAQGVGPLELIAAPYPLERLGWHAFQDLCVAVAEECLKRVVQTFLPSADAGRDGAFIGVWDHQDVSGGSSTIQCKFTSRSQSNLTLSMLKDELTKARALAARGLAADYIIMTNHGVTGASELAIASAFQAEGVGHCRIFHRDWIVNQIKASARLRMLAPRLYGLGDFSDLLDSRAYAQARLILLEMRDSLEKLVVTEVHRKSVRALNDHGVVLLLGAPATGKSTIGGSLAIGAADLWGSPTIRITSPQQLEVHLSSNIPQFFWIDDAWGSTQFQRDRTEPWNQMFPVMHAATRIGSRFLMTSRDYIWKQAKDELKLTAFPVLRRSQVVIDVEDFTVIEKAQILFNHLKMGDQTAGFRKAVKRFLPQIARSRSFSPESARRFGATTFTERLGLDTESVTAFFEKPEAFLLETIENLSADARAAVALVFTGGGAVRSPVASEDAKAAAEAFGVGVSEMKAQLEALEGSVLHLAQGERGLHWTYKHPTIGDAFSNYVARSPERLDIFLRGAKPETLVREVICAGAVLAGAKLVVPDSHHKVLADRIDHLHGGALTVFLSYRSNAAFSALMLQRRPDLWRRLQYFDTPLKDDLDSIFLAALHRQKLLPEDIRLRFVDAVCEFATTAVDASFLEDEDIAAVLTTDEREAILDEVKGAVLGDIPGHIHRVRMDWDRDYPPEDQFTTLKDSLRTFLRALGNRVDTASLMAAASREIAAAIRTMQEDYYEPPESRNAPVAQAAAALDDLDELFRDVDE